MADPIDDWEDVNDWEDVPEEPDATSIASAPFGPQENPVHATSAGEAFVQGVGNSIAGTGDLWGAILQAGLAEVTDIPDLLSGKKTLRQVQEDRNRVFSDARADNLSRSQRGMEEHTGASIAGRIVPSLALAPVTGVGNTLAAALASGAVQGGVEGAAQSDADNVGDLATDTGKGMGFGALGAGAGHGLGKYIVAPAGAWAGRKLGEALSRGSGSLRDGLRRFGQERALKAAGYIQKDFPKSEPAKLERLLGRGQTLLDEPGLIRPGSSVSGIADRLEPLVEREGQAIGSALDAADAAAQSGQWVGGVADDVELPANGFNPYPFINDAERTIAKPASQNPSLETEGAAIRRWLERLRETTNDVAADGEPFTFRRANQYKGDLQSKIFNAAGDVKANKALANRLQGQMIEAIDTQAEPFIGAEGVDAFRAARGRFGAFTDAMSKAQQGTNREVGNNFVSLGDRQAAQVAQDAVQGVPYIGPLAAAVSKVSRGRMDSTAARGADALAKSQALQRLTEASPDAVGAYGSAVGGAVGAIAGDAITEYLSRSAPDKRADRSSGDVVEDLATNNPEALGPYAQQLQQAVAEGNLPLVHYVLQQKDPQYRALLEQVRTGAAQ